MKIKQLFFLLVIAGFDGLLPQNVQAKTEAVHMPRPGTPEFDTMMAEQMASLDKFLAEQSPQEQEEILKFLTDLGQEIINEAAQKGYDDPFEYLEKELGPALEAEEGPSGPVEAPAVKTPEAVEQPPLIKSEMERAEYLQHIMRALATIINSLRQKVQSSSELANKLVPYKYRLDDLVYFLRLFDEENLITYVAKKEFNELSQQLESLYETLYPLSNKLVVPEFSLEGYDPYVILEIPHSASHQEIVKAYHDKSAELTPDLVRKELAKKGASKEEIARATQRAEEKSDKVAKAYETLRQKEEAAFLVDKMLSEIAKATEANGILDGFKKVLEAYKPEALKKSQEREKVEAQARRQQEMALKAKPTVRHEFDMPKPRFGGPGFAPKAPAYYPSAPSFYAPSTPYGGGGAPGLGGGGAKPAGGKAKKPEGKKEEKKEEKEKDKEKEGKKPEKEGEKEKKTPERDVVKKVVAIEQETDAILDILKEGKKLLEPNNKSFKTGQTFARNFLFYLREPLKDTDESRTQAKMVQQVLVALAERFNSISRTIKNANKAFKDKKENAEAYQKELQTLLTNFEKKDEIKDLKEMLLALKDDSDNFSIQVKEQAAPLTITMIPAKRFIYFGIVPKIEFSPKIMELNTRITKTDGEEIQEHDNYIKALRDSYATAQNLLLGKKVEAGEPEKEKKKEEKKVPQRGGKQRDGREQEQEKPEVIDPEVARRIALVNNEMMGINKVFADNPKFTENLYKGLLEPFGNTDPEINQVEQQQAVLKELAQRWIMLDNLIGDARQAFKDDQKKLTTYNTVLSERLDRFGEDKNILQLGELLQILPAEGGSFYVTGPDGQQIKLVMTPPKQFIFYGTPRGVIFQDIQKLNPDNTNYIKNLQDAVFGKRESA
jgi:hypothetical protein